jgi:hypothetical protein
VADALSDRCAHFNALSTEHFVVESARGIAVGESGSRAWRYLATLSSAPVGVGFLAHTRFAVGFLTAAISVIVLLGVFTYVRLVETAQEDIAALSSPVYPSLLRTLVPGAEDTSDACRSAWPNEMLPSARRHRGEVSSRSPLPPPS